MIYSDELGDWLLVGVWESSINAQKFLINSDSDIVLRFTPSLNWSKWEINSLIRSYASYSFQYGLSVTNKSINFKYYPSKIPQVKKHELIKVGTLEPLRLEIVAARRRYYKWQNYINFLPWSLKIEQLIND